jgi:hypothetical protein
MPYFVDEDNCVRKGTKEEPGEVVKCHEERAAAVAHLKALYVNVEDADKGSPSSGWYGPPEGTHTAENAPNFAGGPGADREYGTESDEPPEGTKRCKCTKCGAVVVLPKGKQCEDIECPACEGGMAQTEPRKDPKAEGEEGRQPKAGREKAAVGTPGATLHGEGGAIGEVASVMGEDGDCKCPHCGEGLPCTAKACPHCKKSIDKVERGEGDKAMDEDRWLLEEAEKAEWTASYKNGLPDSSFLYVESGEKDEEGKTTPRSKRHLPYKDADGKVDLPHLRNAISRLGQPATGKGWMSEELRKRLLSKAQGILKKHGGEKSFTVYKGAHDEWRWMSISSWAVVDKEAEVVSEQAYRDAIAYARKSGQWGELDLVHVDGTDVGDCDQLFILKREGIPSKFGAGGTWHSTARATRAREAIQADPAHWGVSLKFRFDPAHKVRGVYTGDVQVLKHSVLPQEMAASYGTAIAVQGGNMSKQLDDKQRQVLLDLGHTEDEIAELAQKQKALPDGRRRRERQTR